MTTLAPPPSRRQEEEKKRSSFITIDLTDESLTIMDSINKAFVNVGLLPLPQDEVENYVIKLEKC